MQTSPFVIFQNGGSDKEIITQKSKYVKRKEYQR